MPFYATYSPSAASGAVVTANQGTNPWIVAGNGTAGTASTGVVTIQGIAGGTAIPISGSITATNPSVAVTGAAVPADATYIGMSVSGNLTGLVGTANGVKTDGSAVTQPVSAVSLPLPTGASTAAKQPALGTAGTASSDVLTVQGIASMTPLLVNGSGSTQPVSGTVTANQGGTWTVQPGNTANTTPWLATVSQGGNAATVSAGGALKVDASGSTQPVSGTVTVTQATGTNLHTVVDSGTLTAVTAITNALPAGTNAIGSVIPTATSAATFQAEGSVAFGSLTTSFATILTPSASTKIIYMRNNTNQPVLVSFDAGTTTNFVLDAGDQMSIDYVANGMIASTSAVQVKYTGTAPTSGSMRVNACH